MSQERCSAVNNHMALAHDGGQRSSDHEHERMEMRQPFTRTTILCSVDSGLAIDAQNRQCTEKQRPE